MELNLSTKYQAVSSTGDAAELSLGDILSFSEKTLLFFYPRDNTPGCTIENKDFSCMVQEFKDLWIILVWVSQDTVESHQKFIDDHDLQIDLICDPDFILHKELWAYGEKNNYWKIVTGVIRSTFLLNSDWKILQQWKNVKATGHAAKVMREIEK